MTGTLHEKLCTFITISRSLPLGMRNLFRTKVAEKIKISVVCPITFFSKIIQGNEVMLKNMVVLDMPQITT